MRAQEFAAVIVESRLATVLLTASAISWILSNMMAFTVSHYLAFTPANTILSHFFLWNLVTQLVVELDALSLLVSILSVFACVIPVERRLGTERTLLLVLAVTVSSSVTLIILSAVLYGATGSFWLYQAFAGFAPGAVVCAVVLYHVTRGADYVFPAMSSSTPLLSTIRTRHLPFCIMLYAALKDTWSRVLFPAESSVMTEMDIGSVDEVFEGPMLPMVALNFIITWVIIRFYGIGWTQMSAYRNISSSATHGSATSGDAAVGEGPDVTTSFAMHQFVFPAALRSACLVLTTVVFRGARVLGVGKDIERAELQAMAAGAEASRDAEYATLLPMALSATAYQPSAVASASLNSLAPLPGSTAADADRRRAVALAALTARLQQHQSEQPSSTGRHRGDPLAPNQPTPREDDDAFSLNIRPADDEAAQEQ